MKKKIEAIMLGHRFTLNPDSSTGEFTITQDGVQIVITTPQAHALAENILKRIERKP